MAANDSTNRSRGTPAKVLFGCITDASPKFLFQAMRLALSLREFGGAAASADFLVGAVDGMPAAYERVFSRLQCRVIPVPRYDRRHGPSNKLRFFDHADGGRYECAVLADCDVLIVRDPSPWLTRESVRAKIADLATLPEEYLRRVFDFFGRDYPVADYSTTIDRQPMISYCNAGFVIIGGGIWDEFGRRWLSYNRRVVDHPALMGPYSFFSDQASLCLAVNDVIDRFEELGPEANFSIHLPLKRMPEDLFEVDPAVVHYHHKVDPHSGLVLPSGIPSVDRRVSAFNEVFARFVERLPAGLLKDYRAFMADLDPRAAAADTTRPWLTGLVRAICQSYRPRSLLDLGGAVPTARAWFPRGAYRLVTDSRYVFDTRAEPGSRDALWRDPEALPPLPEAELMVCNATLDLLRIVGDPGKLAEKLLETGFRCALLGHEGPSPPGQVLQARLDDVGEAFVGLGVAEVQLIADDRRRHLFLRAGAPPPGNDEALG